MTFIKNNNISFQKLVLTRYKLNRSPAIFIPSRNMWSLWKSATKIVTNQENQIIREASTTIKSNQKNPSANSSSENQQEESKTSGTGSQGAQKPKELDEKQNTRKSETIFREEPKNHPAQQDTKLPPSKTKEGCDPQKDALGTLGLTTVLVDAPFTPTTTTLVASKEVCYHVVDTFKGSHTTATVFVENTQQSLGVIATSSRAFTEHINGEEKEVFTEPVSPINMKGEYKTQRISSVMIFNNSDFKREIPKGKIDYRAGIPIETKIRQHADNFNAASHKDLMDAIKKGVPLRSSKKPDSDDNK